MTTGYNAGLDSSDAKISYCTEVTWATLPAVAFKALRMLSEGFLAEKTRVRPQEINPSGYAQHALTTQVIAKGAMNIGLSYSTFDDFLAAALNSAWSAPLAINGIGGDITITNGTNILSSTLSGKFTALVAGQWIRLLGFTNPANNGVFLVATFTDNQHVVLQNSTNTQAFVTETPAGTAAGIRGSYVQNGVAVTTFYFQKQLASALFFQFPGCYVSSLQLSMAVGKFVEGVLNFLVKNGTSATTDASTGAVSAAPTGRIIDNIGGFSAFTVAGAASGAVLQSVDITASKQRAGAQYGIGSSSAQGIRRGTFQVDGKLSLFFNSLNYYNDFINETDLRISWQLTDSNGNAYVITLCAVTLMNPSVVAKGIDQDIVADFTLEGNPAPSTDTLYPNITMQIDRLPIT